MDGRFEWIRKAICVSCERRRNEKKRKRKVKKGGERVLAG